MGVVTSGVGRLKPKSAKLRTLLGSSDDRSNSNFETARLSQYGLGLVYRGPAAQSIFERRGSCGSDSGMQELARTGNECRIGPAAAVGDLGLRRTQYPSVSVAIPLAYPRPTWRQSGALACLGQLACKGACRIERDIDLPQCFTSKFRTQQIHWSVAFAARLPSMWNQFWYYQREAGRTCREKMSNCPARDGNPRIEGRYCGWEH